MKPILVIQNCAAESAGTIIDYLSERALPYQVVHLYKNHPLPQLESLDAIICLGCPHTVIRYSEVAYLRDLYRFVAKATRLDIPYLGLCFGGQLLAKILGARVDKNHIKEIGTYDITLTPAGRAASIFKNIPDTFKAFHWHGDTFHIPFGCENLAESKDCKNQAFQKGKQIALQFHFEASIKEIPLWCDAYTDEMEELGKTKERIIAEYEKVSKEVKSMNHTFLDNFFNLL